MSYGMFSICFSTPDKIQGTVGVPREKISLSVNIVKAEKLRERNTKNSKRRVLVVFQLVCSSILKYIFFRPYTGTRLDKLLVAFAIKPEQGISTSSAT